MDQIVKLASKFKNLDKLTVTLKDYPNGGLKAPDNKEVQRWKDELKAYTSNVRTICIESTSFPNSRRGVEFVVLMASILEGVGKVAFKPYGRGNKLRNPLKNVQFALKRPVYKNCEYVHNIDFCMDDSR
ncbi:hypothetical protein GGI07_003741 [Coemansia sp. Benny D115]|nr:hypothetical protein GGI07_003741 [Coemansia sp. Benny D115]